jgi:hypothetical protein
LFWRKGGESLRGGRACGKTFSGFVWAGSRVEIYTSGVFWRVVGDCDVSMAAGLEVIEQQPSALLATFADGSEAVGNLNIAE